MTYAGSIRNEIYRIKERQRRHRMFGDVEAYQQGFALLEDLREHLRFLIVGVRHDIYGVREKAYKKIVVIRGC